MLNICGKIVNRGLNLKGGVIYIVYTVFILY